MILCDDKNIKDLDEKAWVVFANESETEIAMKMKNKYQFTENKQFSKFKKRGKKILKQQRKKQKELKELLKKHNILNHLKNIQDTSKLPHLKNHNIEINNVYLFKFIIVYIFIIF